MLIVIKGSATPYETASAKRDQTGNDSATSGSPRSVMGLVPCPAEVLNVVLLVDGRYVVFLPFVV